MHCRSTTAHQRAVLVMQFCNRAAAQAPLACAYSERSFVSRKMLVTLTRAVPCCINNAPLPSCPPIKPTIFYMYRIVDEILPCNTPIIP
jgi:hypothetical protein